MVDCIDKKISIIENNAIKPLKNIEGLFEKLIFLESKHFSLSDMISSGKDRSNKFPLNSYYQKLYDLFFSSEAKKKMSKIITDAEPLEAKEKKIKLSGKHRKEIIEIMKMMYPLEEDAKLKEEFKKKIEEYENKEMTYENIKEEL